MPTVSPSPAYLPTQHSPRNRIVYLVMIVVTIALGLATRRMGTHFPALIANYAPDALWALMVFWILGLLLPQARTRTVAGGALAFSYLIEISQLYHASWIDRIRHTTLGGLILGFGFLWSDIACYTVGVIAGVILEYLLRKASKSLSHPPAI